MTPAMAVISMGPWTRETTWTAWAYGHPPKPAIDLLVSHVSGTRPKTTVHVATAVKKFQPMTIEKAIYGTGWDGNVVLEATTDGAWKYIKTGDAPAVPLSRPELVNLNTATVEIVVSTVRCRYFPRELCDDAEVGNRNLGVLECSLQVRATLLSTNYPSLRLLQNLTWPELEVVARHTPVLSARARTVILSEAAPGHWMALVVRI